MGIPTLSLCAILAIVPLLWLPELPARHTVWIMVTGGVLLGLQRSFSLKCIGMGLLFCAWGILAAQESVWPMQHLTTGAVKAEVEITATDGATVHQGNSLHLMANAGGHRRASCCMAITCRKRPARVSAGP